MSHLRITRPTLVGDRVREPGDVIPATGRYAELLVKAGAAVPFSPPIETASAEPRSERATSPRQK